MKLCSQLHVLKFVDAPHQSTVSIIACAESMSGAGAS